jgi:hypothetical protein
MFGYPHASALSGTQNLGLLDTRAAVEWVVQNIRQFGGDPAKITLGGPSPRPPPEARELTVRRAGESVGAEITNQYMSAFAHDPLIRAGVMQSSDSASARPRPAPVLTTRHSVAAAVDAGHAARARRAERELPRVGQSNARLPAHERWARAPEGAVGDGRAVPARDRQHHHLRRVRAARRPDAGDVDADSAAAM